jgi:hypothetical protein
MISAHLYEYYVDVLQDKREVGKILLLLGRVYFIKNVQLNGF